MGDAGDSAGRQSGDARRFAAFISYSHADADAATRLQRRLERYRLPKRIAETRAGDVAALGTIFRDREDFAAASSLSAAIRDAIGRAEALVVMCSPDAAASPWVAAEINLFRELHPEKPILAALLSGKPGVSFPSALISGGSEPLAADLRAEGDGEQLGFLKIVAGIAGVPLDALIQRDAQRRIRRVTTITGGALAAMLIMGIMTTLALQARNEAARQRAEAEGLVEYMLTDLREKLEGVGRLDVQGTVNERALEYYRRQGSLSELAEDSLERRARVLHAMGEDYEKQGDLPKAIGKFREAHRTTEALYKRAPSNPDRIFAHAQSEFYVGLAAWRRLDRITTSRHWHRYSDMAGELAEVEPESIRSRMEQGYAEGNLCELNLRDKFDLTAAAKHCRAAVRYEAEALSKSPDDPLIMQELSNRYGWMANVESARGNYREAIIERKKDAALLDRLLLTDSRNIEYQLRRTWADLGMAEAYLLDAAPKRAIVALTGALERHKALLGSDGDRRIAETHLKILLFLARSQQKAGLSYADNLATAATVAERMKLRGALGAASAESIWAGIWQNRGE